MIEFKNVSLSYNSKLVLKKINLTINDGEFCVLIGASGCGKTTLLKLINKLNKVSSGKVLIDGEDINKLSLRRLPGKIGYVVQEAGLFPHLSVAENIALSLELAEYPKNERDARIDKMLDLVNLEPSLFRDLYPSQLSGGQRQRVGVARAFAPNPSIVIMDEPFSALDPVTRANLQDEILRIQQAMQKTIVFVTHDMDEAIKLASRICILEDGVIAQVGTPAEILKHPVNKDIEEFIGPHKLWRNPDLIKVSEIMLKKVPALENSATVHDARALMKKMEVETLFLTQNGKLLGTITAKSLRWAFWKSTNFDKYLNNNVVTINENATLEDALSCKLDRKTNVIAVIDDEGTLKGYLSKHLLLTMLSKQLIGTEEKVQNNAIISTAMPQNSDSHGQVKAENSLTQEQNSRLPDINAVKEKILSAASKIKNIEVLSNTEGQKLQTQTKEKD